jgi:putative phage-type endonuclease
MEDVNLTVYPTREEWLTARERSIGASESATLFGLSPESRDSAYSLWARKAGVVPARELDGEWLDWGLLLEEPISQRYAALTGQTLWTPPTPFCVAVHPKYSFMTATVDRWIIEAPGYEGRGDLEIKNVSAFNPDWKQNGCIDVPLYIQAQVQHQLACTGFQWAVVAALIGGNHLEMIPVERNDAFIAELEAKAVEFWQMVEHKVPPPVDGKESTLQTLKVMHPNDDGETVPLDDDAASVATKLEEAKAEKKRVEEETKRLEGLLRERLGPHTFGALPDGRLLSLKTTSRKGYTSNVAPTTYRTLKIHEAKGL